MGTDIRDTGAIGAGISGAGINGAGTRPGHGMAQAEPALPAFAEMRAYWEALRTPECLPLRAHLDPRGLKNCLHQALIAERVAPGLARVRLAGAVFNDVMGMEVRGMPLSALFDPMARAPLEGVLNRVFAGAEAATLLLEAERGLGRPALMAQLMLLPMMGELGEVDLALGCLVLRGNTGRTPRRFQILHVKYETIGAAPLTAHEPPMPETPAQQPSVHEQRGPQQSVQTTQILRLQPRERVADVPYLRLVK